MGLLCGDWSLIVDIRDLIGKRCLVKTEQRYGNSGVREVKVLEVSPSGQWVKTQDQHGRKTWQTTTSLSLVEILIDLRGSREERPSA